MVFPTNPFFHRGPIRQAAYFHDRTKEISRALLLLASLQNVAIVGQRRIGKTSLLFHLARPQTFVAHGLAKVTTIFIYVDGGELGELDEAQVRGFLARQLAAAAPEIAKPGDLPSAISHHEFRALIERLTNADHNLFLMLDEFEALAANPALRPRFFSGFRALSSQFNVAFVTASKRSLYDLTYSRSDTLSSPFFNTFAHLNLGLFPTESARVMIETLAGNAGVTFPPDTVERIVTLAGPHPFLLQLAAFNAFEDLGDSGREGRDWELRFADEAEPHFEYYWTHLSPEEQHALAALPLVRTAAGPVIQALEDAALVRRTADGWVYLSPALARFVRRQPVAGFLHSGPFVLDLAGRRAAGSEGPLEITKTEFNALAFFMSNAGRVITREELESALWRDEFVEDPDRVRSVIKGLRKALGADARHLVTKWGEGYILQIAT